MTTTSRDNESSHDDSDSPKLSTAAILIKQRELLMERLKTINPAEIAVPNGNEDTGKSFWDSPHWNSNWNSNWDSNWNSNRWDHTTKNQEPEDENVNLPSLGQD